VSLFSRHREYQPWKMRWSEACPCRKADDPPFEAQILKRDMASPYLHILRAVLAMMVPLKKKVDFT
jgi:hypothetical protein